MLVRACHLKAFASSGFVNPSRLSAQPGFLLSQRHNQWSQWRSNLQIRNATSAIRVVRNEKVNGPASTLPPVLVLPERSQEDSTFKYLFKLGKGYASFYKSGVKAIYTNYQLNKKLGSGEVHTRHDFQLRSRVRHDLRRIPVFVLIFAVCGEFTPLLIPFLSAVVPGTCKIPRQVERDRNKLESHRSSSFKALQLSNFAREGVEQFPDSIQALDGQQARHISTSLYLHARFLDILALPPTSVLKRRIERRLEYLATDDTLLVKDGGVADLEADELVLACVERGIPIVDRPHDTLRKDLQNWLDHVSKSYERAAIERWLSK